MEYIFVCPKCGAATGYNTQVCDTGRGEPCSVCGERAVFSGYTRDVWDKLESNRRTAIVSELSPENVRQEQADANVYCRYCGQKILREALICPHCGCKTDKPDEDDVPSMGLNVLSFFFPVIGLILYCVFYNRTPKKANGVGKAALISVGIQFALGLILGISGVSMLSFLG